MMQLSRLPFLFLTPRKNLDASRSPVAIPTGAPCSVETIYIRATHSSAQTRMVVCTCGRDDPWLVVVLEVWIDTGGLDEDGKIGREARRVIEVRRG